MAVNPLSNPIEPKRPAGTATTAGSRTDRATADRTPETTTSASDATADRVDLRKIDEYTAIAREETAPREDRVEQARQRVQQGDYQSPDFVRSLAMRLIDTGVTRG